MTAVFVKFTPIKVIAGLAFALNLLLLFGLGEYPKQINNAEEMIASLAVIDISNWTPQMLNVFLYSTYGLIFALLAGYVLIILGLKIGRWVLLTSMLAALPMPLILGGIVSTMAEVPLEILISMLDGCLIYLLFFQKNQHG